MSLKSRSQTGFVLLCVVWVSIVLAGCAGDAANAPPPAITSGATVGARSPSTGAEITSTATMLSREEALLVEAQHASSQSAASRDQCPEILKTETWCSVVQSVRRITFPEWEQLFPRARFYLEDYDRWGGDDPPVTRQHILIVEQDGQRYYPETFGLLLTANRIKVVKENRELVTRSWALMTIPGYLSQDVKFTSWEPNQDPRYASLQAYDLKGWARLDGTELAWFFAFANGKCSFYASGPAISGWHIGDYVDRDSLDDVTPQDNHGCFNTIN